jgi:hypothetical protein
VVWSHVVRFVLVRLVSLSRREEVFTLNLVFKKCFKGCTFSAVCTDNAVVNCITVQHKKKFNSRQPLQVMSHCGSSL